MSRLAVALSSVILLLACAAEVQRPAGDELGTSEVAQQLALEQPVSGFQLATTGSVVEPGDDLRTCEVVQLPGGPSDLYYVSRLDAAMTDGSRDLIVSAAVPGSETAAIMDVGARVPCTRAGEAFGEDLFEVLSTQEPYLERRFPEAVGVRLHGGQKLAVDMHVVNATEASLSAFAKLSFHTSTEGSIAHLAATATFQNLTIYTPPHGKSSHLGECRVGQELLVSELVRRTERRGTSFKVWIAGGERDGELVWRSGSLGDPRRELPQPIRLQPGEGFRFQCDYDNSTDVELRFGVNAGDEMCALSASYWVPESSEPHSPEGCLLLRVDADGVARR